MIWAAWAVYAGLSAYLRTDAARPLRDLQKEELVGRREENTRRKAEEAAAAEAAKAEARALWFRWQ